MTGTIYEKTNEYMCLSMGLKLGNLSKYGKENTYTCRIFFKNLVEEHTSLYGIMT